MSKDLLQAPKGTRDLSGEEVLLFTELENLSRRIFSSYQFSELRTPIFESAALFSRSLGETSDVVEKEMFTFEDRGERAFALRPEGTAGVVRFFIENKLFVKGATHRLYYMGPMFRAERPQAGRYRQFWQIGCEYFGDEGPVSDADVVFLTARILSEFGAGPFTIHVNSIGCPACRPVYKNALLGYLEKKTSLLSEESQRRMKLNPLRVLDSKEDGPKLTDAPRMKDYLCDRCREQYGQYVALIKTGPFDMLENPKLVRGLDYYTGPVFEIVSPELGAQNALAAGGRYDGLVELLGGPPTPGVGFALGMDRLVSLKLKAQGQIKPVTNGKLVVVAPLEEAAVGSSFSLANSLRSAGFAVPPISPKKKLKNVLSGAAEFGATWAVIIGSDEMAKAEATVKNLHSRDQTAVPLNQVVEFLKNKSAG